MEFRVEDIKLVISTIVSIIGLIVAIKRFFLNEINDSIKSMKESIEKNSNDTNDLKHSVSNLENKSLMDDKTDEMKLEKLDSKIDINDSGIRDIRGKLEKLQDSVIRIDKVIYNLSKETANYNEFLKKLANDKNG